MIFNIKEKFNCYEITSERNCYFYKSKFLAINSTIQDKDGGIYATLTNDHRDDTDYSIKALHKSYTFTGILHEHSTNTTIEVVGTGPYKPHKYYKYNSDGTRDCICQVSIEPKLIKNFQVEIIDTDHKFALLILICTIARKRSSINRGFLFVGPFGAH